MARKYTPRVRTQLRQAQRVERQNKRAAAEQLYRDVLKSNPEVAEAWVGLGNLTGDSAEKEAAYRKALELDPDNNAAKVALGMEPTPEPEPEKEVEAAPIEDKADPLGLYADAEPAPPAPPSVEEARMQASSTPAPAPEAIQQADTITAGRPETLEVVAHSHQVDAGVAEAVLACKNHPDRETSLRCYRCNEPICMTCAKRTSVGYLCPQCVYEAEEKFFTATTRDYIVGFVVAFLLSAVAAFFADLLGFWIIFVAAAVGTLIGTLVFYAVGRRRGRYLPQIVAAMVVAGAAPSILSSLVFGFGTFNAIWLVVYVVLATSSAYYRMRY
jgi:hypothetical protein